MPAWVRAGVDEATGQGLTAAALAQRVGWCASLVSGMAAELVGAHWNRGDVDTLSAGFDAAGRDLPSNAWMALRRLGWNVAAAEGVKVNDRIVRMAQELAGRALRGVKWRADVVAGVLATWPAEPGRRTAVEWEQVRAVIPDGQHLPSGVIRARTRQITAFCRERGRLPADVFELEPDPRVPALLLLSACDKQQATIERADDGRRVLLRVQLPTRPDPRSYRDWTWVACPIALPPTVPAAAVVHLPTLRIIHGRVRADIAFTQPVPTATRTGHTVALGVDWGLNTLLCAGPARISPDGRITTVGAGAQFRAGGVLAKAHRLRRNGERLRAKTDQYARLGDPALDGKAGRLAVQLQRLDARRRTLNDALAWAAARWAVDQAITAGATVVYLEDLRSMEAGGMGATINTRLSQTVRGRIVARMRHIAAEVAIAVVTVPPRDTSKRCPCCLTPLRHIKAPDQPTTPGWKWARCPNPGCGWQGDRDHGAWRRIAARGLTHQTTTTLDRTSGAMAIRTVVEAMEAAAAITPAPKTPRVDRSKTGPTRRRTTTRPAPRRRGVPSPANAGQRPEGHVTRTRWLPRAATRNQDVHTTSNTTHRHQPKGAALGAGFHLHAHATPPRWSQPNDSYGFA